MTYFGANLGPFGSNLVHFGPAGLAHFGPFWPKFGPILAHFGPFWPILTHFGPLCVIGVLLRPSEALGRAQGPSGGPT